MFGAIKNPRQTLRKAAERAAATLARAVRIQISQMLSPARVFGAIIPAQLFGIVNLGPTVYFRNAGGASRSALTARVLLAMGSPREPM